MRPSSPPLSLHFSQADKARPSSLLPPRVRPPVSRSLFRLIDVIVMPARQQKQKHTIFSFASPPSHPMLQQEQCFQNVYAGSAFAPNQTLLAVLSVLCGSTWWCNFTLCFLLLAWGCWGLQGVASWENEARWGLGWWESSPVNRSVSFLFWTAEMTWSVITVVSCWDTDNTALLLALLIYCIDDLTSSLCLMCYYEIRIQKERKILSHSEGL